MGEVSGGIYDYPLMIQEWILYLNWCIQNRYNDKKDRFIFATLKINSSSLEPLPSIVVRGPDHLQMPILRFPNNPLAFLPSLTLQRVSGAVQHPSLSVKDTFEPTETLRRHVLEAYFKGILRRHSTGRLIADGSTQHHAGTTMDIAEVYSNGLRSICKAIAYVVSDEAISNFMMTDLHLVSRWNLMSYSVKVITELCKAVSPLVGHPLLSKDPVVHKLGLYDTPNYTGATNSIHSRLVGYTLSMTRDCLRGADVRYNHRSIGIFSSDNDRVLSETLMTAFLCDLYLWRSQGLLSVDVLRNIMAKKLIPLIRAHHEEQDKVDTLIRSVMKLSVGLKISNPNVSSVLEAFSKSRVIGYKTTVADILKATRKTDEWGIPEKLDLSQKKIMKLPKSLPIARSFSFLGCDKVINGVRSLDSNLEARSNVLCSMYLRSKGRAGLMSGSATYVWAQFAPLFRSKPMIVIGVGMGAIARVALDAGCPHVYGVDLRSTIPLRSHRFRHYKPPLVMASQYEGSYTQLPESFTTNGDWFDPSVCEKILQYDQGDATVAIDIQQGSHRFGLESLTDVLLRKTHGTIIIRLYLTETETRMILSDLHVSGFKFTAFDIWRTLDIGHVVVVLQHWTDTLKVAVIPRVETACHLINPPCQTDLTPEELSIAMSDAVFNTVYLSADHSIFDLEIEIDRALDEAWGDYDSRLSYYDWTKWLRAKVVTQWLVLPEKHRIPHLLLWLREGRTEVSTPKGRKSFVNVDWSFAYHLVTVASRVLS